MNNRTLPPFALFDYWGVPHEGTVGECAEEIRRLYALRRAQSDWKQHPIPEPAFGDNLRTWRLLNRMSLRYVSKTIGQRRRRLKVSENGYVRLYTLHSLLDLYRQQNSFLFIKLDMQDSLLRDIAQGTSITGQLLSPMENPSIENMIGHNLKWVRIHRILSLREASMRSGVPVSEIQKLEDGAGADIALSRLVQLGLIYGEPCPIKLMHPDYSSTGLSVLKSGEFIELKKQIEHVEELLEEYIAIKSTQENEEAGLYEAKQH